MLGQTHEIAPADRRLYALRDVTGTVESMPLIAASIMSKKLAEGLNGLVLDVKRGSGAFIPTAGARARARADDDRPGQRHGCRTVALLTAMDRPLGHACGNALEVEEAIAGLRGEGPADLMAVDLRAGRRDAAAPRASTASRAAAKARLAAGARQRRRAREAAAHDRGAGRQSRRRRRSRRAAAGAGTARSGRRRVTASSARWCPATIGRGDQRAWAAGASACRGPHRSVRRLPHHGEAGARGAAGPAARHHSRARRARAGASVAGHSTGAVRFGETPEPAPAHFTSRHRRLAWRCSREHQLSVVRAARRRRPGALAGAAPAPASRARRSHHPSRGAGAGGARGAGAWAHRIACRSTTVTTGARAPRARRSTCDTPETRKPPPVVAVVAGNDDG